MVHVNLPQTLVHLGLQSIHLAQHPLRHLVQFLQRLVRQLPGVVQRRLRVGHLGIGIGSVLRIDRSVVTEFVDRRLTVFDLLQVGVVGELSFLASFEGEAGGFERPFDGLEGWRDFLVVFVVFDFVDGGEGGEDVGDGFEGWEGFVVGVVVVVVVGIVGVVGIARVCGVVVIVIDIDIDVDVDVDIDIDIGNIAGGTIGFGRVVILHHPEERLPQLVHVGGSVLRDIDQELGRLGHRFDVRLERLQILLHLLEGRPVRRLLQLPPAHDPRLDPGLDEEVLGLLLEVLRRRLQRLLLVLGRVLLLGRLEDLRLGREERRDGRTALQLGVDLHPPQEPLEVPPPLFHQLLAEPPGAVDGLRVRDDGDDGPGPLGVEALEEPLEVRVAAADGREGVAVAAGADVDAVEGVAVAALAEFLGVRHGEVEDDVAVAVAGGGGGGGGGVVAAFDGAFAFGFLVVEVVVVVVVVIVVVVVVAVGRDGGRGAGGRRGGRAEGQLEVAHGRRAVVEELFVGVDGQGVRHADGFEGAGGRAVFHGTETITLRIW
mmetsp:Transcript_17059/g.35519  ORF Transcript_17059/g.35519 Transcript_17059/m.35519 type:complete len:543 (-) Transcript_17059:39-1667(-)